MSIGHHLVLCRSRYEARWAVAVCDDASQLLCCSPIVVCKVVVMAVIVVNVMASVAVVILLKAVSL